MTPWTRVQALPAELFSAYRRRAIFDCCKWDPQVEDTCTIANVPLVLTADTWRELVRLTEMLAQEVLAAEEELRRRPELHGALGLPRSVRHALRRARVDAATPVARLARFDFHHTRDGWRISEANTDVPGGLNEASGLAPLIAPHYEGVIPAGDPATAYAQAIVRGCPSPAIVALVHATAYSDDGQVMAYVGECLVENGATTTLVSPAHIQWDGGRALVRTDWMSATIDAVVRFFPAEWLPNLPSACGWPHFFHTALTPVSNPATAVLTQSKRFPLIWDSLQTPLPTWRWLLPETRDPLEVPWRKSDEWVLKPALGRVGEGVAIRGVTDAKEWHRIARAVRRRPSYWVSQRRFVSSRLCVDDKEFYPVIGMYAIDGVAVGAYGRLGERPVIDGRASDAAVLIAAEDVTATALRSGPITEATES